MHRPSSADEEEELHPDEMRRFAFFSSDDLKSSFILFSFKIKPKRSR